VKTPTLITQFLGTGLSRGPRPEDLEDEEFESSRKGKVTRDRRQGMGLRVLYPKIIKCCAGGGFSMAMSSEGEVFTWGLSAAGRLGFRTKFRAQLRPRRLESVKDGITDIGAGGAFGLLCTAQGKLISFGENSKGQLGNGNLIDTYEPTTLTKVSAFCRVACGESHSLALDIKGKVYAWGAGGGPAIGDGRPLPCEQVLVHALRFNLKDLRYRWCQPIELYLSDILVIFAGFSHSLALSKEALYSWGSPLQSARRENPENCWIPRLVAPSPILPLINITSSSAGGWHSLVTGKHHTAIHVLKLQRGGRYLDGVVTCKDDVRIPVSTAALRARLMTDTQLIPIWHKLESEIEPLLGVAHDEAELSNLALTFRRDDSLSPIRAHERLNLTSGAENEESSSNIITRLEF